MKTNTSKDNLCEEALSAHSTPYLTKSSTELLLKYDLLAERPLLFVSKNY